MIKSAWTDEWENPDTPAPLGMPLQPLLIEEATRRIDRASHHKDSGAEALAGYFVGQIVGSMNKSKPAAQVVLELVTEFVDAMENVNTQVNAE